VLAFEDAEAQQTAELAAEPRSPRRGGRSPRRAGHGTSRSCSTRSPVTTPSGDTPSWSIPDGSVWPATPSRWRRERHRDGRRPSHPRRHEHGRHVPRSRTGSRRTTRSRLRTTFTRIRTQAGGVLAV